MPFQSIFVSISYFLSFIYFFFFFPFFFSFFVRLQSFVLINFIFSSTLHFTSWRYCALQYTTLHLVVLSWLELSLEFLISIPRSNFFWKKRKVKVNVSQTVLKWRVTKIVRSLHAYHVFQTWYEFYPKIEKWVISAIVFLIWNIIVVQHTSNKKNQKIFCVHKYHKLFFSYF